MPMTTFTNSSSVLFFFFRSSCVVGTTSKLCLYDYTAEGFALQCFIIFVLQFVLAAYTGMWLIVLYRPSLALEGLANPCPASQIELAKLTYWELLSRASCLRSVWAIPIFIVLVESTDVIRIDQYHCTTYPIHCQ